MTWNSKSRFRSGDATIVAIPRIVKVACGGWKSEIYAATRRQDEMD